MNDNGLVEIWIKLSAQESPEVTGITDIACQPEENGREVLSIGAVQRTIFARRSTRSYKPDMVPKETLERILKAGTYAASGMNHQSPIILAVTNRDMRDKLSAMNAKILGKDDDPFYGAPVVLVVLADKDMPTYLYDGSLVIGNMMLAAEELGIASCWVHRAKEEFASNEGKEILASLGIEGNYEGIGHLVLGYADEEAQPAPARKEHYVYYVE
ncbi:MAG: nitroreductase [Eubacterium sp.]|nr:nitroreductase [Eubacterium sp.]